MENKIVLFAVDMYCIYNLLVGYQAQYAKMLVIYTRTEFPLCRRVK